MSYFNPEFKIVIFNCCYTLQDCIVSTCLLFISEGVCSGMRMKQATTTTTIAYTNTNTLLVFSAADTTNAGDLYSMEDLEANKPALKQSTLQRLLKQVGKDGRRLGRQRVAEGIANPTPGDGADRVYRARRLADDR